MENLKESNEPESGDCQRITADRKANWLYDIMVDTNEQRTNKPGCRIHTVPQWLLNIEANKKCFEPAVVSIGPYHHGKPKLQTIQNLKTKSVGRFVRKFKSDISYLYRKVESVTNVAKKYYTDESTEAKFDDEAFADMMFLDGCFIWNFIDCMTCGCSHDELMAFGNDIQSIYRDLFLLENQLPYVVLKVLLDPERADEGGRLKLHLFINSQTGTKGIPDLDYPLHILDFFRSKLVGNSPIIVGNSSISLNSGQSYSDWRSYPPVKELEAKGIKFKMNHSSSCLYEVDFQSHQFYGELLLPAIEFNHSTKDMFLNLIAYELTSNLHYAFISYICFLDTLVRHADDAKVLQSKGIIYNCLGSNEEVANLINHLATGLVHDPYTYMGVKLGIDEHCRNKRKVYFAGFMHTCFRSPWTIIALLIAASFVIFPAYVLKIYATIFTR